MTLRLRTDRMTLDPIQPSDLDDLVALDSDPEVMRYISGGVPTPREDYLGPDGLLTRMMRYDHEPHGYWAARTDGEFVGWFHLRPSVADPNVLEIGYRLAQKFWRQGFATEGAVAMGKLNFDTFGHSQMDAVAVPENTGSFAVMRKVGMQHVGELIHPRVPGLLVHRFLCTERQFRASDGLST